MTYQRLDAPGGVTALGRRSIGADQAWVARGSDFSPAVTGVRTLRLRYRWRRTIRYPQPPRRRLSDRGLPVHASNSFVRRYRSGDRPGDAHGNEERCRRRWPITTNDNEPAITFYTHWGMRLAAVHRGAITESRQLKPEISLSGVERRYRPGHHCLVTGALRTGGPDRGLRSVRLLAGVSVSRAVARR